MIRDEKYQDVLFIFNDNTDDHNTDTKGGGNGIIRMYNKHGFDNNFRQLKIYETENHYTPLHPKKPRSAGISTGDNEGFTSLGQNIMVNGETITVQDNIDSEINEIKEIMRQHKYRKVFYSKSESQDPVIGDIIGMSIFTASDRVRRYISQEIKKLVWVQI